MAGTVVKEQVGGKQMGRNWESEKKWAWRKMVELEKMEEKLETQEKKIEEQQKMDKRMDNKTEDA